MERTPEERRSDARRPIHIPATASYERDRPLPNCTVVDASTAGMLLAFAEPVGLSEGDRIIVSLMLRDGRCHVLGTVGRAARGDDFRTYVAIRVDHAWEDEIRRLQAHVADPDMFTVARDLEGDAEFRAPW
jgi:hypothetical protein